MRKLSLHSLLLAISLLTTLPASASEFDGGCNILVYYWRKLSRLDSADLQKFKRLAERDGALGKGFGKGVENDIIDGLYFYVRLGKLDLALEILRNLPPEAKAALNDLKRNDSDATIAHLAQCTGESLKLMPSADATALIHRAILAPEGSLPENLGRLASILAMVSRSQTGASDPLWRRMDRAAAYYASSRQSPTMIGNEADMRRNLSIAFRATTINPLDKGANLDLIKREAAASFDSVRRGYADLLALVQRTAPGFRLGREPTVRAASSEAFQEILTLADTLQANMERTFLNGMRLERLSPNEVAYSPNDELGRVFLRYAQNVAGRVRPPANASRELIARDREIFSTRFFSLRGLLGIGNIPAWVDPGQGTNPR